MELSIIIAIKNEEENIHKLVTEIKKHLNSKYELLFISDSEDQSNNIIKTMAKKEKNIVLHTPKKNDLTQSIAYGIKKAQYDTLCIMDGDLSHPIAHINNMLKYNNDYDLIIATRTNFEKIKNWPIQRKIMSRIAQLLAYPLLPIKDNMSGFFMIKKKNLNNIEFKTTGYKILLEIVAKNKNIKIKELPYKFQNRIKGESQINITIIIKFIKSLPYLYYHKYIK